MDNNQKMNYFIIFTYLILKNYNEINPDKFIERLDFMKLQFFCVVKNNELLNYFNNQCALPKWPIESDFYNRITSFWFNWFESLINWDYRKKFLTRLESRMNKDDDSSKKVYSIVEQCIKEMKKFFYLTTDELVIHSHRYNSWITTFNKALAEGKKSAPIKHNDITEEKFIDI